MATVRVVSPRPLLGHTAVVTHGGTGVGLAIARELASAGADIVLLDADPDVGTVASRLRSDLGMPVMGARGELSDPAFMSTAFRAAVEHLDFPDLLVRAGADGQDVALEAFRARLLAAGKAGVCVTIVDRGVASLRHDGEIVHGEVGRDALPGEVVRCWLQARPSNCA